MAEQTLVAFAMIEFVCRRRGQQKEKIARRKEWMRPVFQEEARRASTRFLS